MVITRKNRITLTALGLVTFAILMFGLFLITPLKLKEMFASTKKLDLSQFHGTFLKEGRNISSFSLKGIDNTLFTNQSLKGQWTMMFFGFTHCSSVCPTTMIELSKMYKNLEKKLIKPLPKIVFISIDPTHDSLKNLKNYVAAFHPDFYAARGNERAIKKMTTELGIAFNAVPAKVNNSLKTLNDDIQHSGTIVLFNPEGKLTAFFTTPHVADLLTEDYQKLVVG